jgi:hypothetical protein
MKTIFTALLLIATASSTAFAGHGSCGQSRGSYHVQHYSSGSSYYSPPRVEAPQPEFIDEATGEVIIYQSKRKSAGGSGIGAQQSSANVQSKKSKLPVASQKPQLSGSAASAALSQKQRTVLQAQKIQSSGQGAVVPLRPDLQSGEGLSVDEEAASPGDELDPELFERPDSPESPASPGSPSIE